MNAKDILSTTAKFPFVMVLTAIFLRGSVFLSINIPVIAEVFKGSSYTSISSLLDSAIVSAWKYSIQIFGNILTLPAFLFFSLISGLCLTPIERVIAFLVTKVASLICRNFKSLIMFSGAEAVSSDYAALLSWLLSNPDKKMHWEWELFYYHVQWGVFLNIALFSCVTLYLLWPTISVKHMLLYVVVTMFFLIFALARSAIMGQVHSFYEKQFKERA